MPVIPALRRLRIEDLQPAWSTYQNPVSKTKERKGVGRTEERTTFFEHLLLASHV
jgi:hypothetical protein